MRGGLGFDCTRASGDVARVHVAGDPLGTHRGSPFPVRQYPKIPPAICPRDASHCGVPRLQCVASFVVRVVYVAVAGLMAVVDARADCFRIELHEAFAAAESVFLADVRGVGSRNVVFDIREGFKNVRRGALNLEIASSYPYVFRAGETALVFVSRLRVPRSAGVNGVLVDDRDVVTTTCSPTRRSGSDDPDIPILRHLARRDSGGTVEGVLARFDSRWLRYPGVRISLRPLGRSGRAHHTVTGPGGGYYRFDWVAPGNYIVLLEAPPGVRNQQRLIYVAPDQRILRVPAFIISADEHRLLAPPE